MAVMAVPRLEGKALTPAENRRRKTSETRTGLPQEAVKLSYNCMELAGRPAMTRKISLKQLLQRTQSSHGLSARSTTTEPELVM